MPGHYRTRDYKGYTFDVKHVVERILNEKTRHFRNVSRWSYQVNTMVVSGFATKQAAVEAAIAYIDNLADGMVAFDPTQPTGE